MFTELFKYPETFASLPGDFTYWHKNRKKYAVWAIEPDLPELTERFNQARVHLAPFLLPEKQNEDQDVSFFHISRMSGIRHMNHDHSCSHS